MFPMGFEPTVSAGERPQTYALDSAAIGPACRALVHTNNERGLSLQTDYLGWSGWYRQILQYEKKTNVLHPLFFKERSFTFYYFLYTSGLPNVADVDSRNI
jgi:hypothetical protein